VTANTEKPCVGGARARRSLGVDRSDGAARSMLKEMSVATGDGDEAIRALRVRGASRHRHRGGPTALCLGLNRPRCWTSRPFSGGWRK